MGDSPEAVSVAGFSCAVGDKCHGVTAGRGRSPDGHKAGSDFRLLLIPFHAVVFDNVDHLHHQAVFRFHAVADSHRLTHGKMLHILKDTTPQTGNINADVGHVVLTKQLLNLCRLPFPVHSLPVEYAQHAKFFASHDRRRDNHEGGCVPAACRVIACPHFTIAEWPWQVFVMILPDNGAYLSPVNAIHYLAERLAGTGGNTDVVIMMVTGQTHENFMKGLNSLVDVFPAPAFTQVRRLAESAATLATEKMQIPAKAGAGLPVAIPLSVPTSRAALSAAAISEAQKAAGAGFSLDGLKQQLGEFTQLRDSLINDVASGLADLQGKSARAWVFTASGDTAATLLALVKDIPQPSAVYTAAIMLAGKNLDGIRGMIHDVDPDTGA